MSTKGKLTFFALLLLMFILIYRRFEISYGGRNSLVAAFLEPIVRNGTTSIALEQPPDDVNSNNVRTVTRTDPTPNDVQEKYEEPTMELDMKKEPFSNDIPSENEERIFTNSTEEVELGGCSIQSRVRHARRVCDEEHWSEVALDWSDMGLTRIVVDSKHRLVYGMISKAGSHTIRTMLGKLVVDLRPYMMYPLETYLNYTGFEKLQKMKAAHRAEALRDYLKIVVTRHPFSRLRSVYLNKMAVPGGLNAQVLRNKEGMVADYLRSVGQLQANESFDPLLDRLTFKQFVHLVSTKFAEGFQDEHWVPQRRMACPCRIHYDYIFRVETFDDDIQILVDYLRSKGEDLPSIPKSVNVAEDLEANQKLKAVNEAYSTIDEATIQGLVKLYTDDFKIFGYSWNVSQGALCAVESTDKDICC